MKRKYLLKFRRLANGLLVVGLVATMTSCAATRNFWNTLRTEGVGAALKGPGVGDQDAAIDSGKATAGSGGKNGVRTITSTAKASDDLALPSLTKPKVEKKGSTEILSGSGIKRITDAAPKISSPAKEKATSSKPSVKTQSNGSSGSKGQTYAIQIPGKPGYVRTPYTNPGRVIDVRDYAPGSQVRCPYTRKIFLVPGAGSVAAATSKPKSSGGSSSSGSSSTKSSSTTSKASSSLASNTKSGGASSSKQSSGSNKSGSAGSSSSSTKSGGSSKTVAGTQSKTANSGGTSTKSGVSSSSSSKSTGNSSGSKSGSSSANNAKATAAASKKAAEEKRMADAAAKKLATSSKSGGSTKSGSSSAKGSNASKTSGSTTSSSKDSSNSGGSSKSTASTSSNKSTGTKGGSAGGTKSGSSSSNKAGGSAESAEHPFGSRIPGQPGLVNSPYAEKHQIVNVQGLDTGVLVRCPYSGKIFRVPPPLGQASDKGAAASPKKKDNKKK